MLWLQGKIPFRFDNSLPPSSPLRKTLLKAIEHYNQTLLGIIEFTDCGHCRSQQNYLLLAQRPHCSTDLVGRRKVKGKQVLGFNSQCNFRGVAIHLLGHVIGLYHQHQRKDRNDFITMLPSHFPGGPKDATLWPTYPQAFGLYDPESIMHYSSWPSHGHALHPSFILKKAPSRHQALVENGWPWTPQGTTLRDRSALWELYATAWGWQPFQREHSRTPNHIRFLGPPAVLEISPNHWKQWVRAQDNHLYQRTGKGHTSPILWSPWKKMSEDVLTTDPVAAMTKEGTPGILATDTHGQILLFLLDKKRVIHGPFTLSSPALVPLPSGEWELFIRGTDYSIYHSTYSPTLTQTEVLEWEDLGGQASAPPAASLSQTEDRIDLIIPDSEGKLWSKIWSKEKWWPSSQGWFQGWSKGDQGDFQLFQEKDNLASYSPVSINSCAPGVFTILAKGPEGILYTKFWFGQWGDWVPIGGIVKSSITTLCDVKGDLHLWALGEDKEIWHRVFSLNENNHET